MKRKRIVKLFLYLLGGVVLGVLIYLIVFKNRDDQMVERTALFTSTEYFCEMTEQSKPFAYFQFTYLENGEMQSVRTKTTCRDLQKIGVSNDAAANPTILGEKIKLKYHNRQPVKIIREDGTSFGVEQGEQNLIFLNSKIDVYESLEFFKNTNYDQLVNECLMIKNDDQHDRCLSFQAAFEENLNICNKMNLDSNKNLCKEWISNIKSGKANLYPIPSN